MITAGNFILLNALYFSRSPNDTVNLMKLITKVNTLTDNTSYYTLITSKTHKVKLDKSLKLLQPTVSQQDVYIMQEIVATFSIVMTEASLTFFLYSGSLLGSWRHHGLVPWDDDLDVVVPSWQKDAVAHVLNGLKPHYLLDATRRVR
ncbi:hypothetical protein C0Q70_20619 [Pomacea canaliculata]|uniref:LicD/FKTN/FKRP nucleotidyltransferase domain-containing protein n=1 Tax=Pomacea canaliculata TaxID=400727 RepID=A0A2T7NG40_POMCA|nr:hypothetical protein C0Q70_20619 [Pomacea canaliculata]